MPQTRAAIKSRSVRQQIENCEGQQRSLFQGAAGRVDRPGRSTTRPPTAPVFFKSNSAGKLRKRHAAAGS